MGILEKMKSIKQEFDSKKGTGGGGRTKGLFFKPQKENKIRFIGDFMLCFTHNINKNDPILLLDNDKMFSVACLNWDYENQKEIDGGCPICRLNKIFFQRMSRESDPARKEAIKKLSLSCLSRKGVKWNVIDANDPYYTKVEDGMEVRVSGPKVWRLPGKVYEDIEKKALEAEIEITDPINGTWFKLTKEETAYNTKYDINFFMSKGQVEVTPLSEEFRKFVPHDLKLITDYALSANEIIAALRPDLREELDLDGGTPAPKVAFKAHDHSDSSSAKANPNLGEDTRVPWATNEEEADGNKEPETPKMHNACFGKFDSDDVECRSCSSHDECKVEARRRLLNDE